MSRTLLHATFLTLLLALALWLPLPLYLVSIALFGLPHVIWEMGFLRSRYAARWPARWWFGLWAVLLIQAGARGATWSGHYPATSSQIIDLLTLLLLAVLVALAPKGAGWRVRIAGLIMASAMLYLLQEGHILWVLLLLGVAHNFTPVVMAWDMARQYPPARTLAWFISGLFVLPLIVAGSGWKGGFAPAPVQQYLGLLDGLWPMGWGGDQRAALLSAIVLAQCLHYYCVIHLLPRAETRRVARPVITTPVCIAACLAVASLLVYFAHDYAAARSLYGIAAGAHAWLEWPILLMALLGSGPGNRQSLQPTASSVSA
ncbi:MAG TPA: hypothetical protein VLC08_03995 [Chitinolyticbacter sp.]|nr:hypothetical protein [Chitinolyticbacter sp.]